MSIVAHDAKGSPWSLVWIDPARAGMDDEVRLECRMTARELVTMGKTGVLPGRLCESLERYAGALERTLRLVEEGKPKPRGKLMDTPPPPTDADADPLAKHKDRAF